MNIFCVTDSSGNLHHFKADDYKCVHAPVKTGEEISANFTLDGKIVAEFANAIAIVRDPLCPSCGSEQEGHEIGKN